MTLKWSFRGKHTFLLKLFSASICVSLLFGVFLAVRNLYGRDAYKLSYLQDNPKQENGSTINRGNLMAHVTDSKQPIKTKLELFEKTGMSSDVHIFYYSWYSNPRIDGHYSHWNHEYIPHWEKSTAKKYKEGRHKPPHDIGANFYPELGAYSSRDPRVIEEHMSQIRKAGIGVIAVSWYPPGSSDQHDADQPDRLIPVLLNAAKRFHLKITLQIEPYKGRDIFNLKKNLCYIIEQYSRHEAFYKHTNNRTLAQRPLMYVYDSYLIRADEWRKILHPDGELSIRNDVNCDATLIGLLVDEKHQFEITTAGFDGFYTYFGSNGFSFGSSRQNWKSLATFAKKNNLIFVPSVAPGYIDTMVRPWNSRTSRKRHHGRYYDDEWRAVINIDVGLVSVTSFNEWHEGTQIETAVPKSTAIFKYVDYQPDPPDFYLTRTYEWIKIFVNKK